MYVFRFCCRAGVLVHSDILWAGSTGWRDI